MRRVAVLAFLVLLAAAAPAGADDRSGPVQLGAAINDAGFAFGGSAYRDTFTQHHDAATPESAMKTAALHRQPHEYDFARADEIVAWARGAGKRVHGHVLIWCEDYWEPSWLTSRTWTRDELLAVMEDHIRTVMDHFEGEVETWDVVNEALDAAGARKDCVWQRSIGDDWVQQAYRIARDADPSARLFYNEYAADVPGPKFDALVALVRGLDVDGVGLQNHTYGIAPLQYDTEDLIARLGALGLDVHLSELDVTTMQIGGDLARQAQAYWTLAAACQAQPACFRITTWGFTDAYGWRAPSEQAMPFDVDYAPKPAWHAIQRALGREAAPAPPMPGPPAPSAALTQSAVAIAWPAVEGATFTLQHRDAGAEGWRTLASGIPSTSFDLPFEREGTWTYRVRAEDGEWSAPSAPVVVDRTPPPAPAVTPAQPWFRDLAAVTLFAADPPLPDGSPGSGVEAAAPATLAATGPLTGTVRDRAGNVSPEGGGVVQVDASAPAVALTCPRAIVRGAAVLGRWSASDEGSGLATPPGGAVRLRASGRTAVTVRDVVGHAATASCVYAVRPPLVLRRARATLRRDGTVRVLIGCRLAACRTTLTLRRGRAVVGRSRTVHVGRTTAVRVRLRRAVPSVTVFAGRDRLGTLQTRRPSIQADVASSRAIG
ncbi:MAG TPA: endo-1,4-beta-xylanase [Solirubrobacteraceae bacterium]|jgi:endo-1,4-beta-xylanase